MGTTSPLHTLVVIETEDGQDARQKTPRADMRNLGDAGSLGSWGTASDVDLRDILGKPNQSPGVFKTGGI